MSILSNFDHKIHVQTFQDKKHLGWKKRPQHAMSCSDKRGSDSDRGMHQGGIGDPGDSGWGKNDEFVDTEKVILQLKVE